MLEFPNVKHPRMPHWGEIRRVDWGELTHVRSGRSTPCIGDKLIQPLIGNPYNGYIFTPTIGLMSLSLIIGKQWELIDPGSHDNN